jgi:surfeit locus 1 family protein
MPLRLILPLLFGIAGCAVLIGLGIWQLNRMEEKRLYLDQIEARIYNTPIALPDTPNEADHKFQAVTVTGAFTGEVVEVLFGIKGASPGVRIIEGFVTTDGRRIMIDRGFIEDDKRALPRTAGVGTVIGHMHWPIDATSSTPPPDEKTGLWFARDVGAMAAKLSTEPTFIVAREPTGDGIAPVPVDTSTIPNDHWGYAITWFLLAAVWAVMTAGLMWRIRRQAV